MGLFVMNRDNSKEELFKCAVDSLQLFISHYPSFPKSPTYLLDQAVDFIEKLKKQVEEEEWV